MTNLDRALNLFAAMDSIPDEYICSAEETLSKAETGAPRPAKSMEALRRFVSSRWGAAVASGAVVAAVLLCVFHMGRTTPPVVPPIAPDNGTVQETALETDNGTVQETVNDPDMLTVEGVFFWANGAPYIHLPSMGEMYPVQLSLKNETIDLTGLTSGDTVEAVIANRIEELFPCRGRLYDIRKISDGSLSDLPDGLVERLQEMGYTVTETKRDEPEEDLTAETAVEGGTFEETTAEAETVVETPIEGTIETVVVEGMFFWANGAPCIHLPSMGEMYPVQLSLENETIDLTGLTSGDTVEAVIANRIEELFPCRGRLYDIRKISDGSLSDLPNGLADRMQEMGYTVTEDRE